jgi:hypothetical protein
VLINNAGHSIRRPIHDSYDRLHDFERTMALPGRGSQDRASVTPKALRSRERFALEPSDFPHGHG